MLQRIFGRRESNTQVAESGPGNGHHKPQPREFPVGATCGAGCGRT